MLKALKIICELLINRGLHSFNSLSGNYDLYSIFVMIAYLFSIGLIIYITFKMEKNKLFYGFLFTLFTTAVWLYADMHKHTAITPDQVLAWMKVEYIGRIFSAPAWFFLGEVYTKRYEKFRLKAFIVIAFLFTSLYSAAITNLNMNDITPAHTLYGSNMSIYLGYALTYLVIFINICKLNRFAFRHKGVFIKQVRLISMGIFFTFIIDILTLLNVIKISIDLVPIGHFLFLVFLWKAITKFRLLEVIPVALREVFNNMDDGVIVLNEDGSILDINKAASDYLGEYYNPKTDISIFETIFKLTPKISNAPELIENLKSILKTPQKAFHTEVTIKGEPPRYFDISIGPIYDARKRPIGFIINMDNITDYKQLLIKNEDQNFILQEQNEELEAQKEELEAQKDELVAVNAQLEQAYNDLQDAQAQLIQSEKMAALGNLVAGVAHEINTPLGSINSNIDITKLISQKLLKHSEVDSDDEVKKLVEKIDKINEVNYIACKRILEIVRSLKNFSRLDEAEFQKANIHEGIDNTLILINNQIKNRITVHKNYGDIPEIQCYPNQLNQVFMNILVNASQAIEGSGDIYINTFKRDENVVVEIIDSGKGIKPENLSKVFDPGFTTKGVGVGTGLGLSITYKIIEKHNGKISAENAEGLGAKFTITLPINNESDNNEKSEV